MRVLRVSLLLAFATTAHGFAPAHLTISSRPAIASRALQPTVLARIPAASRNAVVVPAPPANSALPRWRRLLLRARAATVAVFFAFALAMSAPCAATAVPTPTTMTTVQQQDARSMHVYRNVRDVPRLTDGRIVDLAGYELQRSTDLAAAIHDFESSVHAPVYVVTLPSIGRRKSEVKAFATRLFNEWSIGSRGTTKGVLVLIVKDVRRIEVEVGQRLNGIVSHSWTTRMLANDVTPLLKDGKHPRGVEKAVRRLAARIENDGNAGLPKNWYRSPAYWVASGKTEEAEDAIRALGIGVGGSALATAYGGVAIAENRRARTCDTCGGVVTEAWRIGRWKMLWPATYASTGRRERTLHCHKCGAVSTKVQVLPRLVESSGGGSDTCSDGGGGGGGDF